MSYWAEKAKWKRQKEKTASKKTREDLMKSYHYLRDIKDAEQHGKNEVSKIEAMDRVSAESD